MSLSMLGQMVESYMDGDLDLVEELVEDTYHDTEGKFSSMAQASSLSLGDNAEKFKMKSGKRKGRVRSCGRAARRDSNNILCYTGKPPSYAAGRKRRARASGAGPQATQAAPASRGGGKRKRVLRRKDASSAKRALRSRGHDLGSKSLKSLKRAVGQLTKGLNRATSEKGKDKFRAALDVLQPEFEKRGEPNFVEKASRIMATRLSTGTSRLRKKRQPRAVAAEDYFYGDDFEMMEDLADDAADLLADMFDDEDED
jgi:hypothetical protein